MKKTDKAQAPRLSPGRHQYLKFKEQYPDALLLFRIGDFYETFDEDARTMARVLDIALTSRSVGGGTKALLAGIPYHALNSYLARLIKAGLKVAIAEQVSDPKTSKGLVERDVIRVITPGTVVEGSLLDPVKSNYLAAVTCHKDSVGVACIDLTTSEFFVQELAAQRVQDEIERLNPSEVLVDTAARTILADSRFLLRDVKSTMVDLNFATERIKSHFKVADLEVFGCRDKPLATIAAGLVLDFLYETQRGIVPQVTKLRTKMPEGFVQLDRHVLRDLELFTALDGDEKGANLYRCIDYTSTPLGARLLRSWLVNPLVDVSAINDRQNALATLHTSGHRLAKIVEILKQISDFERLNNRLRTYSANPRDLVAISGGLKLIPQLKSLLRECGDSFKSIEARLHPLSEFVDLVDKAIVDEPPVALGDGRAIRKNFNTELDNLTSLSGNTRATLQKLERSEQEKTRIKSLKVGYNKIFGYYIEITRSGLGNVPERFERKQTLANAERFTTPELKDLESRILRSKELIDEIEKTVFARICTELNDYTDRVMEIAAIVAEVDVLCSYATCALRNGWSRPKVDGSDIISITNGRHPIVESTLGAGRFVPNDSCLSIASEQVSIITGPNMSGKSTFIRMVAVLVLLAQIGSYIPAESAQIGVVDGIFTRTGLSDDIAGGRSTFMVEMTETAAILNRATPRSLVILDEIGRGTSTYDGLAVAQAIVEFIHNEPRLGCRTLFATHYHELTALEQIMPRVVNYQIAVTEKDGEVHFLHRIVRGGADRSYGVYVARLAGIPLPVINRAQRLLKHFESASKDDPKQIQLSLSPDLLPDPQPKTDDSELKKTLNKLDLDAMTPLEALKTLNELKNKS